MDEIKIGETFTHGGMKFKVCVLSEEDVRHMCDLCDIKDCVENDPSIPECGAYRREDNEDVYFKKIIKE